jgi:hypothetical protein
MTFEEYKSKLQEREKIKEDIKNPVEKEKKLQEFKDNLSYVDRRSIVHAVLADRMKDRDPGNAPQSNDRIPYAYVITKGKPKLQGERVEHPEYIDEKKLKLDYLFYITNQIMKPSIQFLELLVENPQKLFDEYITRELNRRMGKKPVGAYFQKTKKNTDIGDIEILNNFKTDDIIANINKKKPRAKPRTKKKAKSKYPENISLKKSNNGFKLDL